jgi:hypothetical protein
MAPFEEARVEKRHGTMRALAGAVAKVAGPALGKGGFAAAQLVTQWEAVMGAEWAEKLGPERLDFPRGERQGGTLRLRAAPGAALEAQHSLPLLLERINGFFGYRAVERLVFVQGPPLRPRKKAKPFVPLAAEDRAALDRRLGEIEDPGLREALRRLGEAVMGSEKAE